MTNHLREAKDYLEAAGKLNPHEENADAYALLALGHVLVVLVEMAEEVIKNAKVDKRLALMFEDVK